MRHDTFKGPLGSDDYPVIPGLNDFEQSFFACMMNESDDIWADMDTSTALPDSAQTQPMALLGDDWNQLNFTVQHFQHEMEGDDNEDGLAWPGMGDAVDPTLDSFVASMMSHEHLFADPQRLLKAPYYTNQWMHEQLTRVVEARDVEYSRKWLGIMGNEMPLDRYVPYFEQAVDEFLFMSKCAAENTPPVQLPITVFTRAVDVFMVCKAVAMGLHEMPVDGDDDGAMDDDNNMRLPGWSPDAQKWGPFLPSFSECELFEAALHLFATDFMQRGCLSPFGFPTSSKTQSMIAALRVLLEVSRKNSMPVFVQPMDMFTLRVVRHLREAVASNVRLSAANVLPDAVQEVLVSYTMDVTTEVDFYIANALSASPAASGSCAAFIQVLHAQLLRSVFCVGLRPYTEFKTDTGDANNVPTPDFMGGLCLPVAERLRRLPAVDSHSRLVREFTLSVKSRPLLHQHPGALLKLQALDTKRRRKMRRELRLMANSGVNLIRTYPNTAHTVRGIMMMIKRLPPDRKLWSAWSPLVTSQLTFMAERLRANMKPVELPACKKAEPTSSSMQLGA